MRSFWNWFGAAFGIVVLVGAGVLYLLGRSESAADNPEATVAQPVVAEGADSEPQASADPVDQATETIEIEMVEFGYVPETIDIEAGKPVILRFSNTGRIVHEAMIGDIHMQEEFAGEGGHENGDADGEHRGDLMSITLESGETGDLEVMIDQPGEWFIGCHLTGHFEAGMVSTINVTG